MLKLRDRVKKVDIHNKLRVNFLIDFNLKTPLNLFSKFKMKCMKNRINNKKVGIQALNVEIEERKLLRNNLQRK